MQFNNLKLSEWVIRTCQRIKYTRPTQIQRLAIPAIVLGESVILNAETGSGKTAAFGLPLLELLSREPTSIFAVILAPSMELAMQIHTQMIAFGQTLNLRSALLVGGVNYSRQEQMLDLYPHIVVATPGRLAQMLGKSVRLARDMARVQVLVLDEADRLFQQKMLPEINVILGSMGNVKQYLLATATINDNFEAKKLRELLGGGVQFKKMSTFEGLRTVDRLEQSYIFTAEGLKPGYLLQILDENVGSKVVVFVGRCKECTLIYETLLRMEYSVVQLHAGMRNSQRVASLSMFRDDRAKVLISTDLSSRGLDINQVNLVVNYNLPRTVADYVHRVGRTARNGFAGEAVSFVTPNQVDAFLAIEQAIGLKIGAHPFNQNPDLGATTKFNRKKREVKIHLAACGAMEYMDNKKKRNI